MDNAIAYQIRDAGNVLLGITNNRKLLDDNGFKEETLTGLTNARALMISKDEAQQIAVKVFNELTDTQNKEIIYSQDLLKQVINASKSAYGDNPSKLAPYKVNERVPNTVKKLCARLSYTSEIVQADKADLIGNGLTEEDCVSLQNESAKLDEADTAQESARKKQKSATIERDSASEDLKVKVRKFRSFIDARFSKKPEIKVQFEPIPKGRGGSNDDTPPTPPPAQ